MVGVFTTLVWGAAVASTPTLRFAWTAFWFSWVFATSAAVVATHIAKTGRVKTSMRPT